MKTPSWRTFCLAVLCWSLFVPVAEAGKKTFRITIVSARISPAKHNKMNWDSGFGKTRLPDVYVLLRVGKQTFRTRVIRNSLHPVWKQSWIVRADRKKDTLFVVLRDKDLQLDDPIGEGELVWTGKQKTYLGQAEQLLVRIEEWKPQKKHAVLKRVLPAARATSRPSSRPAFRKSTHKPSSRNRH